MLIAIAAAAALSSTQPTLTNEQYRAWQDRTKVQAEAVVAAQAKLIADRNRCAAKVMEASAPGVRYDHWAPDPGAKDQQPYRGEALLFSTVELKVEGCSLPVLRARATDTPAVQQDAAPVDY